ncbi:MAG: SRPBCC family protein [Acidimicrobiales bacterium]
MSVDVVTEIVIDRPVEAVSAYAADPSHAPEWYATHRLGRVEDAAADRGRVPAAVHGPVPRAAARLHLRDRRPRARRAAGHATAEGPFPMETTYTWTAGPPSSTHMTLRNRGEPAGFSKLAAPLMAPMMRRANTKDLHRLKSILEGSATPPAS